jgi:hypothetical protein
MNNVLPNIFFLPCSSDQKDFADLCIEKRCFARFPFKSLGVIDFYPFLSFDRFLRKPFSKLLSGFVIRSIKG